MVNAVFFPVHATRACRGSRRVNPLILNIATRWRWVINFTPRPLCCLGRSPVHIEQEAWWRPESVWMFWSREESLAEEASVMITVIKLNVYGSVHRKNIPIHIQQDATLHSLFYLETALHVSGGTSTHHQERIQLYLQHLLFVTRLLLPAASGR